MKIEILQPDNGQIAEFDSSSKLFKNWHQSDKELDSKQQSLTPIMTQSSKRSIKKAYKNEPVLSVSGKSGGNKSSRQNMTQSSLQNTNELNGTLACNNSNAIRDLNRELPTQYFDEKRIATSQSQKAKRRDVQNKIPKQSRSKSQKQI